MLRDTDLEPFARLALACLHRQYPYHLVHLVNSDDDVRPPRELYPAFHGCFDWHSAVHSHWSLVRCVKTLPDAPYAGEARAALARNLTESNLAGEMQYLLQPHHAGFECPYGLAWLLTLAAELRDFHEPRYAKWLRPLESLAAERIAAWVQRLSHPIRTGEHSQSAFSMGLAIDYARITGNSEFESILRSRALDFYQADRGAPLHFEPSGYDFLSPALSEADLMRRVLKPREFSDWLDGFLVEIPRDGSIGWLTPVVSSDPSDGKLSHLIGLNITRAWMLRQIASALRAGDPRIAALSRAAQTHADAGLSAISADHYAGAHWLGSFAVYLLTGGSRNLPSRQPSISTSGGT